MKEVSRRVVGTRHMKENCQIAIDVTEGAPVR